MTESNTKNFAHRAKVTRLSTAVAVIVGIALIIVFLVLGNSSKKSSPGAIITMATLSTTTSTTSGVNITTPTVATTTTTTARVNVTTPTVATTSTTVKKRG